MSGPLPKRIETERLLLREPRLADAAALFAAYTQDAVVARYMTWRPHTSLSETEAFMADCVRAWNDGARMPYVLTMRDQSATVGVLDARIHGHIVDIGYVLARPLWGQGLMPEAIRAVVQAALEVPGLLRVQATCDVENSASARALERAGFSREGRLECHTVHPNVSPEPRPCYMYALCRVAGMPIELAGGRRRLELP